MEWDLLLQQTQASIQGQIKLPDYHPGKVSLWLKFIRLVELDGSTIEENVGSVSKLILPAMAPEQLIRAVAENMLLMVFGAELPVVSHLPNLIIKLFDAKAFVQVAGAPPLHQPGQIYLKATVYEHSPGLWEQLFGRRPKSDETSGA